MGCDAYANDAGEFEIEVRLYRNSEVIGHIYIKNLEPREKIAVEYLEGEAR